MVNNWQTVGCLLLGKMTKKWIYALIAVSLSATSVAVSAWADDVFDAQVAAAKQQARVEFPQLKDEKSDLFKLVNHAASVLQEQKSSALLDPEWPLHLARKAAQRLAEINAGNISKNLKDIEVMIVYLRGMARASKSNSERERYLQMVALYEAARAELTPP